MTFNPEAYGYDNRSEFQVDSIKALGLTGHPAANTLFNIAWDDHHSSGYGQVWQEMQRLALLVNISDDARDAMRWRALFNGSARFHYMGSANFEMTKLDPQGPDNKRFNLAPSAKPGEYLHFGMEFWSEYHAPQGMSIDNAFEQRLLIAYVDELIKRGQV